MDLSGYQTAIVLATGLLLHLLELFVQFVGHSGPRNGVIDRFGFGS